MLRTLPHARALSSEPTFGLKPCKTGPHPWTRLPEELAILVLAAWEGEGLQAAVDAAARVDRQWDAMLQWAQHDTYKGLQQRTMLRQVTASTEVPPSGLTMQRLRRYDELRFDVVPLQEGLDKALHEVTQEQLAIVAGLMAPVTQCHLEGLLEGAKLVVLWARTSNIMQSVRRLSLGRGKLVHHELRKLLGTADKMPDLAHVALSGKVTLPRCHSPVSVGEGDETAADAALDFAPWAHLQSLDLSEGDLNVSRLVLRSNVSLQDLDLRGNTGAAELLFSDGCPGKNLKSLRLTATGLLPGQCAMFQDAPWAAHLQSLYLSPASNGAGTSEACLKNLRLSNIVSLQHLELAGVPVCYDSLRIEGCDLRTLNLAQSDMSCDNQPCPNFFARKPLHTLRLGQNHLTGLLNELDFFAAPNLKHLDLSRCRLNDVDFVYWQVPERNRLQHLDVSDNNLDCAGLHGLALKPLRSLRYLGIRVHKERGAQRLVQAVLRLSPLRQFWPQLQTMSILINQVRNAQHQERLQTMLQEENITLECFEGPS